MKPAISQYTPGDGDGIGESACQFTLACMASMLSRVKQESPSNSCFALFLITTRGFCAGLRAVLHGPGGLRIRWCRRVELENILIQWDCPPAGIIRLLKGRP